MHHQRMLLVVALLTTGAPAQWLNYPTPGIPRTRDGKPNLTAPAPRALDGKLDLSGVWHVHPTPRAEIKLLYGDNFGISNAPGMEIGTQSKYAFNILLDFKPEEEAMRPEAAAIFRRRVPGDLPSTFCLPQGIPLTLLIWPATPTAKPCGSPNATIAATSDIWMSK